MFTLTIFLVTHFCTFHYLFIPLSDSSANDPRFTPLKIFQNVFFIFCVTLNMFTLLIYIFGTLKIYPSLNICDNLPFNTMSSCENESP